jgi:hypothetical protein
MVVNTLLFAPKLTPLVIELQLHTYTHPSLGLRFIYDLVDIWK